MSKAEYYIDEHEAKKCRHCKKLLPLADYNISSVAYRTFRPDCRKCESAKRYARKKNKE